MEKMRQALDRVNSRRKQAWDRAVFLRPGLNEDRSMYLMFLRARRFEPTDAAELMVAYFQAKRDLFGDDLLIHRITWSDLTEKEHAIFRCGAFRILPNYDRAGRGVYVIRLSQIDFSDEWKSFARCIWYVHSLIEDYPSLQQKGIVTVADYGGTWKSSPFQIIRFTSTFPKDSIPFHIVSVHFLDIDSA